MSDDMFGRFDTIPACDGQTDRQTDILRRHRVVKISGGYYRDIMPSQRHLLPSMRAIVRQFFKFHHAMRRLNRQCNCQQMRRILSRH